MTSYIRADIFRNATPLVTLSDIIEGKVRFTLGRANDFNIRIANPDNIILTPGFLKQGDLMDIYMGQEDDYSKIMSGTIYKINKPENEVILSGYDWTDFLVGPKTTRRYEYKDYGYILRNLIKTYAPKLSTDYLLDTGQILDGEYISRYDDLVEVIEDILDTIGYRLIVTTDKKVLIFPKEEAPIVLDSFITDISSDDSAWNNFNANWLRHERDHLMWHISTVDHLYCKGIRKASVLSNLTAKCKIYLVAEGGTKRWTGLTFKGDDSENCCFGYLDKLNNKLIVGVNPETTATTDLIINMGEWYPLELELNNTTLTASVGMTQVSVTLSSIPSGTYASIDADMYARFDDYGLYSTAKHSLTEDDIYEYDLSDDLSDITNRVIIIGGNETKYDGFDNTLTLDRWTIPAGSAWTVSEGYLTPTTASYIFGGNQYWEYINYAMNAKYDSSARYDMLFRRTSSTGDHNDGFSLKIENNEIHLVCATDGTIASHTLDSPPSLGDSFKVNVLTDRNVHQIYFDDIRRINVEDEHYPKGFIGLYSTTNAQIDLINAKSDKKIIASAQDSSLFGYGIKEEVISEPKIRDRTEALSRASLELNLKNVTKTSGIIKVPGDYKYSIGDTISLDLPSSLEVNPKEYLILDVKQNWKSKEYLTELKIAEKRAGIEELIRQLREETRGLAVRELEITDLIGTVEDSIPTISDSATYTRKDTGTFRLDEAQLEVSDLG